MDKKSFITLGPEEPLTTTTRPEPKLSTILTEDYKRNIFAFAFALGATLSFVTFFYGNVFFFAWQQQRQVTIQRVVLRLKEFTIIMTQLLRLSSSVSS